jgi:hypothetical protein
VQRDLADARNQLASMPTADDPGFPKEGRKALAKARAPVEQRAQALEQELERTKSDISARNKRYQNDAQVLAQIRGFLQQQEQQPRDASLEPCPVVVPDGSNLVGVRAGISDAQAKIKALQRVGPQFEEMRAELHAYVQALIEKGRPLLEIRGGQLHVNFKRHRLHEPAPPAEATFAWLYPGAFMERLEEQLAELPELQGETITRAERERLLKEHRAEILRLERIEEALVTQAISNGQDVLRRPDANPLAILGCEVASNKVGKQSKEQSQESEQQAAA